MRDAGSEVLPLSQVGGYVLGARAIILRGVAAPLAFTLSLRAIRGCSPPPHAAASAASAASGSSARLTAGSRSMR